MNQNPYESPAPVASEAGGKFRLSGSAFALVALFVLIAVLTVCDALVVLDHERKAESRASPSAINQAARIETPTVKTLSD
jgi:hypothetical protein